MKNLRFFLIIPPLNIFVNKIKAQEREPDRAHFISEKTEPHVIDKNIKMFYNYYVWLMTELCTLQSISYRLGKEK